MAVAWVLSTICKNRKAYATRGALLKNTKLCCEKPRLSLEKSWAL